MSADEFDPEIERLFGRTPHMADSALFASGVEARLASGSRVRAVALAAAGLIGGVFAVRESMNLSFTLSSSDGAGGALGRGIEAAGPGVNDVVRSLADYAGVSDAGFGALGGMQLFWIVAGTLVAAAAVGIVKLSQEA